MSFHPRNDVFSVLSTLSHLNRPKLLLRAARHGTCDYNRDIELRRILRVASTPQPSLGVLRRLIDLEAEQNDARTRTEAEVGAPWRATRHIDVLIALIAEARLLSNTIIEIPRG